MTGRPAKVALLVTSVEYGGIEKVMLTLLSNVDNSSFELVPVVFARYGEDGGVFFKELERAGKRYFKITVNKSRLKYLNPILNIAEAYRLLKRERFDMIHANGYRADVLGLFLSRLTALPVVSTCHGYINNGSRLKIYNKLDRYALRRFNRVLAASEGIKDELLKSGVGEESISVVSNAVETSTDKERFLKNRKEKRSLVRMNEDGFIIGYIGRLSAEKGIRHLLDAVSALDASCPVKVLIIGEGPQKEELAGFVKGKKLEDLVIFTGFQSQTENWLPALDVFVLPSLTEGTPMALLEAMAAGIPVVASRVGGVPKVIDSGKNGILVSPGDPGEIKGAILALLNDRPLRESISNEARKTIRERYNVRDWTRRIEAEYMKVLNKG